MKRPMNRVSKDESERDRNKFRNFGEKNNPYTEHKEAMKLMKEECKEHNASDRNGKMMVFSECDQDNHHWMKEI